MAAIPRIDIRPAESGDSDQLEYLAQLEGAAIPRGTLLVAEVDQELWAAVAVETGEAVAHPFRPSGHVLAVVRLYASTAGERDRRGEGTWWARLRTWVTHRRDRRASSYRGRLAERHC